MKFLLALWLGKLINLAVKIIDPSKGSNISGQIAMKLDPDMVEHFRVDPGKCLFITGTNGKSSTNNLLNHLARHNGLKLVSNLEGANLLTGVATALLKAASLTGKLEADYFVFETDERFLPLIYKQLPSKNILITNLQKDQVQRNGDPDFIWRKLNKVIGPQTRLFLNNEDPGGRSFASKTDQVDFYSVAKHAQSFTKADLFPTRPCPLCHHELTYAYYNVDSVGPYACSHCDNRSLEDTGRLNQVTDADFEKGTFTFHGLTFKMPYNMPHMLYNYAGALTVADRLFGLSIEACQDSFADFVNIEGRFELVHYRGKEIRYLRIKQENPDTLQTAINVVASDPEPSAFMLSLSPVVDFHPHYHNSFYAYDCDFSKLKDSQVESFIGFYPGVAYESALRFRYAGLDPEKIRLENSLKGQDLLDYMAGLPQDRIYLIFNLQLWEDYDKLLKG